MALTPEKSLPTKTGFADALGQPILPAGDGAGVWAVVVERRRLEIPIGAVGNLIHDVPAWRLWDPGVSRVDLLGGEIGVMGTTCRIHLGVWPWRPIVTHVLVGHAPDRAVVFVGAWRRSVRFIDIIDLESAGKATVLSRRVELHIVGIARLLKPLASRIAARHIRRAADALT